MKSSPTTLSNPANNNKNNKYECKHLLKVNNKTNNKSVNKSQIHTKSSHQPAKTLPSTHYPLSTSFSPIRSFSTSKKSPPLLKQFCKTVHSPFQLSSNRITTSLTMSQPVLEVERLHISKRFCEVAMAGPFVYLSGQLADDITKDIQGQTLETLNNIDKFLADAKTDKSQILSVTIYLKDMADYSAMNEVWDSWVVPGKSPARTCVAASLYAPDVLVEMTVTAVRGTDAV